MKSLEATLTDEKLRCLERTTWARDTRWLPLPPMKAKRQECAVASLSNGCVVVSGGLGGWNEYLDSVELFDPNSTCRSYLPALNYKRAAHVSCRIHNAVYVIGGWGEHNRDLSSVEMLDVTQWIEHGDDEHQTLPMKKETSPQWKLLSESPMPTARCNMASVVIDDSIYVIGGYGGGEALNTVEIFDTKTCKWSTAPSIHVPRWPCRAAVVGGIIYVLGGENSSFETYTPSTTGGEGWCLTDDIFNLKSIRSAAGVGGSLVVMGCDGDSEVWDGKQLRSLPHMRERHNWFASCVLPHGALTIFEGGPYEGSKSISPTNSVELFRFLVDPYPTRAEFEVKFSARKILYETH